MLMDYSPADLLQSLQLLLGPGPGPRRLPLVQKAVEVRVGLRVALQPRTDLGVAPALRDGALPLRRRQLLQQKLQPVRFAGRLWFRSGRLLVPGPSGGRRGRLRRAACGWRCRGAGVGRGDMRQDCRGRQDTGLIVVRVSVGWADLVLLRVLRLGGHVSQHTSNNNDHCKGRQPMGTPHPTRPGPILYCAKNFGLGHWAIFGTQMLGPNPLPSLLMHLWATLHVWGRAAVYPMAIGSMTTTVENSALPDPF